MNFYLKISYILIIFSGIFYSCVEDSSCREENEVFLQIGFYNANTLTAKTIDSIWVHGIGVNDFLYENTKKVKLILLPLKKNGTQSDFILRVNNQTDTLRILHTNQEYLVDYNCGCIITHQLDTILHTNDGIKIAKIEKHTVGNNVQENIRLYY